jgi:hypothetical protein
MLTTKATQRRAGLFQDRQASFFKNGLFLAPILTHLLRRKKAKMRI